jgi:hypothetical protein
VFVAKSFRKKILNKRKAMNDANKSTLLCAVSRNFRKRIYVCSSVDPPFDETDINL